MRTQNQARARTSTLPSRASRASGMRVVRFWSGMRFHQSVSIISGSHYHYFSLGIFASYDKQPTVETVAGVLDSRDGDPSARAQIDRQPYSWIHEYKVTSWPTASITRTRRLTKEEGFRRRKIFAMISQILLKDVLKKERICFIFLRTFPEWRFLTTFNLKKCLFSDLESIFDYIFRVVNSYLDIFRDTIRDTIREANGIYIDSNQYESRSFHEWYRKKCQGSFLQFGRYNRKCFQDRWIDTFLN